MQNEYKFTQNTPNTSRSPYAYLLGDVQLMSAILNRSPNIFEAFETLVKPFPCCARTYNTQNLVGAIDLWNPED